MGDIDRRMNGWNYKTCADTYQFSTVLLSRGRINYNNNMHLNNCARRIPMMDAAIYRSATCHRTWYYYNNNNSMVYYLCCGEGEGGEGSIVIKHVVPIQWNDSYIFYFYIITTLS